jgi:hypothetical protein
MATSTRRKAQGIQRKGRRAMPATRRTRAEVRTEPRALTLGDLIAAAFDTVGPDTDAVADLLSSRSMARALGRRIVIT